MSLNVGSLTSALISWFAAPSDIASASQAADRLAQSYYNYAVTAADVSGDLAVSPTASLFRGPLNFDASDNAATFCQQIETAFVAYWTGAIFAVGIPPTPAAVCPSVGGTGIFATEITSLVIVVAPNVMYNAIFPIVSVAEGTPESKGAQMASAMDTATKSAVTVLITGLDTTPPPVGPLPITNTCTVF